MNWLVGIFPLVVKLIEILEGLSRERGVGEEKKKTVMEVMEVCFTRLRVMGILSSDVESGLKIDVAATIDSIVEIYNRTGVFKHGG